MGEKSVCVGGGVDNLILSLSYLNLSVAPTVLEFKRKLPNRIHETLDGLAFAHLSNLKSDLHFQLQCASVPLTSWFTH